MATYENFSNSLKPAVLIPLTASLVSLVSGKLIKEPLGFKNEANERVKSFLYTSAASALLFPLFFSNWNHLFDKNDDKTNE